MGLASPRRWPCPAKTAGQQTGPTGCRDVYRITLGYLLVTLMSRESNLGEKLFLVTGLIEYPESSGAFILPSAAMVTMMVVIFQASFDTRSLKIVGCRGIGIAKGCG